jgi:hypothetical protein
MEIHTRMVRSNQAPWNLVAEVPRADWEKTSLKPYIEMLDKFAANLMNETRLAKRAAGKYAHP